MDRFDVCFLGTWNPWRLEEGKFEGQPMIDAQFE
jgi:hypothetical protein